MLRTRLQPLASALALTLLAGSALAAPAPIGDGLGSTGSIPTDPIIVQSGTASGTWVELADGSAQLRATLLDDGGLLLYDLVAQATPSSASSGVIAGELFPRIHTLVPADEHLLVFGQYNQTDAKSGVFRAFVVLTLGSPLAPQVPVGFVEGRYGRLVALEPSGAALVVGAGAQVGGLAALDRVALGGQIVCPKGPALAGLAQVGAHGGASAIGHSQQGGVIECPYASSKRMRAFVATHPPEIAGATKPFRTGMTQAEYLRRLRQAGVTLGGGQPLGAPVPVAAYKGLIAATWTFGH